MLRKLVLAVTAALAAAVLSPIAGAQGASGGGRAFRSQTIRAGVLINPGAAGNASAAPFAWYNLDAATSVKPPEWTFVNPNNEGTVSADTYARWSTIDPTIAGGPYATRVANGLRTQKRYASYWEVNLVTASDADLAQYDVLLLAPLGPLQLNPSERGKLNRFVDGGGVLWVDVDPAVTAVDRVNGLPIPFEPVVAGSAAAAVQNDSFHPIFNFPLPIGQTDQNRLAFQYGGGGGYAISPINGLGALASLLQNVPGGGDFSRLRAVSQYQSGGYRPTAMVGKVGDGYQVITVRQVAQKLNRTAADATLNNNRLFLGHEPKLLPEGIAAAKFAVNLVSLTSSSPQFGGGARKGFASGTDVGAPLLNRYVAPYIAPGSVSGDPKKLRPPVVYKGLVFVTEGNSVSVYDADPGRDADGDGDPDDGLIDYSVGTARDLIFQTTPAGGAISSASVTEVVDAVGATPRDQLLVTDETGRVAVYPVYGPVVAGRRRWPTAAGSTIAPAAVIAPTTGAAIASAGQGPNLFSPTVYGSFAYVVDAQQVALASSARLRVIDLRTLTVLASPDNGREFVAGGTAAPTPPPSGPATVGQIPIADNSGGADVVAYVPLRGVGSGNATGPGVVSYWVGAKGEKPFATEIVPNGATSVLKIDTRASTQGGLPIIDTPGTPTPLGFRISVIRNNGRPYTEAELGNLFTGAPTQVNPGVIQIPISISAWPADVDPDNPVRIDYTIDWGQAADPSNNVVPSIERGRLTFSNPVPTNGDARRLIGGIALGPQGTLFATVASQQVGTPSSDPSANGTVYALKEEGRGAFRMAWRWDLYPRHTLAYEGGSTTYESSLPDNDPVQFLRFGGFSLSTVLGGRFTNATIQGAPVVRGDKVFVTVSGAKSLSPSSAVLAFAAEPPQPEIRTNLDLSGGFAIVQPDFARSADPNYPRTQSILSSNNGSGESVIFDKAANGVGGTIRFTSLASVRNGQVVDSISLSQPILIRRPGQGDVLVEPSAQGRWSPLLWYTILHGTTLYGPAYAAGNTLYMSGSSFFPGFIVDGATGTPNVDGYITALRTDVDTTNALPTTQAFTTNTASFSPQSVVLDAERPWMRQVISLDFPRQTAAFNSPQAADTQLYGTPYFVMPQNARNVEDRGRFSVDDYRTRVAQSIIPGTRRPFTGSEIASFGVVGGDRTLLTWNASNTYGYTRADFWVADEGRIARIDPSGNVLFDSRSSLRAGETGESGVANVIPLVRPTRVVPISGDDDLLVVDTGGDKILRMDPNGVVAREMTGFTLDANFVPNGFRNNASLSFKNPRDATTFTTQVLAANNPFTSPAAVEEWVHTLVADQGNNRLLEIVDRIELDPTTFERVQYIRRGTLLWHSPAQVSGKGYDYVSVSRVRIPDGTGARYAYVAGLGSFAPGRQDAGEVPPTNTDPTLPVPAQAPPDGRDSIGGGIVVFDPQLPAGVAVYSSIEVPEIANIHRWDDRLDTINDAFTDRQGLNDLDDGWSTDTGVLPERTFATNNPKRLSGVTSVTASVVLDGSVPRIAVMVADRTGVYEVLPIPVPTTADPNRTILRTRWMLPTEAFRAMRRTGTGTGEQISPDSPEGFLPAYARRIDNENVIVVNGYVGKTRGLFNAAGARITAPIAFNGEVLQIDGRIANGVTTRGNISDGYNVQNDNLGFGSRSIKVRFGVLEGARGILQPVYADRR